MAIDQGDEGCILFLDFDGVTHPDPCEVGQLFTRLPLIEDVLRRFEGCKIVISSNWRVVHPLDEMRGYFAVDMRPLVIGVTPEYRPPRGRETSELAMSYDRQWECEAWLRQRQARPLRNRRTGARWIAIDDREYWFRPGCGNLLLTDGDIGFGLDDAQRLEAMLRQRLS